MPAVVVTASDLSLCANCIFPNALVLVPALLFLRLNPQPKVKIDLNRVIMFIESFFFPL